MRLITICLFLALLGLCGCGGQGQNPDASPTAKSGPGEVSPAFNLTAVDGSTISFKPQENPNGDVTMLVFWSFTWDDNVATLFSRLSELHERYAPRGLRIIAISYDEEPSRLRNFLSSNKTPFPVAVGVDSTYERFGLKSIPTLILVDKAGKIVERWEGHYSTEELSTPLTNYLPGRDGNSNP